MHMIDLRLDPLRLLRFATLRGHQYDDDYGYALHAWFCATLGALAPKPFRAQESRDGGLRVLGYAPADAAAINEHLAAFTEPEALAVADWETLASKPMPSVWPAGHRLGFELRACPVSRGKRERDCYLVALERARAIEEEPPPRADVYRQWLGRQFGEVSAISQVALTGLRRVRVHRQRRSSTGHRRGMQAVDRPDALFTGELTVLDPEGFAVLLARGVGRHRAFGFGMLLLRPPRNVYQ